MTPIAASSGRATGRLAFLAVIVAGLAAMAALQFGKPAPPPDFIELHSGEPAKLSPFLDESGAKVGIDSFRGKVVILNLWAPWCIPCLTEMPALDRLAQRLPEKSFAVVAVTKDGLGDTPSKRTFDKLGLGRLKLYLDPEGKLEPEIGARAFPTTLILGPDGAPLAYREGPTEWDSDAMIAKLDAFAERSRRTE